MLCVSYSIFGLVVPFNNRHTLNHVRIEQARKKVNLSRVRLEMRWHSRRVLLGTKDAISGLEGEVIMLSVPNPIWERLKYCVSNSIFGLVVGHDSCRSVWTGLQLGLSHHLPTI